MVDIKGQNYPSIEVGWWKGNKEASKKLAKRFQLPYCICMRILLHHLFLIAWLAFDVPKTITLLIRIIKQSWTRKYRHSLNYNCSIYNNLFNHYLISRAVADSLKLLKG